MREPPDAAALHDAAEDARLGRAGHRGVPGLRRRGLNPHPPPHHAPSAGGLWGGVASGPARSPREHRKCGCDAPRSPAGCVLGRWRRSWPAGVAVLVPVRPALGGFPRNGGRRDAARPGGYWLPLARGWHTDWRRRTEACADEPVSRSMSSSGPCCGSVRGTHLVEVYSPLVTKLRGPGRRAPHQHRRGI